MNRAERRRRAKLGLPTHKDPVYNMKQSDINKMKEDSTETAIDTAMILLLAIPVKVMHDKYGWRMRKRLPEFAEAILDEYQNFADGDMSLEEYQQLVYDYCGIKFQKNTEV